MAILDVCAADLRITELEAALNVSISSGNQYKKINEDLNSEQYELEQEIEELKHSKYEAEETEERLATQVAVLTKDNSYLKYLLSKACAELACPRDVASLCDWFDDYEKERDLERQRLIASAKNKLTQEEWDVIDNLDPDEWVTITSSIK